jgi:hypothetical protein
MGKTKTSSASKRKYNKTNYRRYEFSIRLDKKLNYYIEDYKEKGGSVSDLIKTALANHFNVNPEEDFYPFKYINGELVQTKFLEDTK